MGYSIKYSKMPIVIIYLFLIVLPFIQLGFSYYASVAFLSFVIIFLLSFRTTILKKKRIIYVILFGCILFLLKTGILYFFQNDLRETLIPLREMLCFIALILISTFLSNAHINYVKVEKILVFFLVVTLLIVIIQKILLSRGVYFGFPVNSFVANQATLNGMDYALKNETRFRPTSFYGEPSYTSSVIFSLLTMLLLFKEVSMRTKYISIFISLLITILSDSFSGILAISLYVALWFLQLIIQKKNFKIGISVIVISFIAVLLILFFSNEFQERILNISRSSDESFSIRMLYPILIIQKMSFPQILFGVNSYTQLMSIDNAAYALFIHYGILSLMLLIALWRFIKDKMIIIYFAIMLSFNGTLFGFDKILIISIVIGLCTCYSLESSKIKTLD